MMGVLSSVCDGSPGDGEVNVYQYSGSYVVDRLVLQCFSICLPRGGGGGVSSVLLYNVITRGPLGTNVGDVFLDEL